MLLIGSGGRLSLANRSRQTDYLVFYRRCSGTSVGWRVGRVAQEAACCATLYVFLNYTHFHSEQVTHIFIECRIRPLIVTWLPSHYCGGLAS